jgi:hypothetical protein
MNDDQPLSGARHRDEAGSGPFLDVRGAVYTADPDKMTLVLAGARRVYVAGPGLRTILAEAGRRAPRLLDGLRDDAPRKPRPGPPPELCQHQVMPLTGGICDSCGEDVFRGCGSLAGMRAGLSARGVRDVSPLAPRDLLAALLDVSGPRPGRRPPAGWRLQCPDCRELDGWHDPGCGTTTAIPRREANLDTDVPGKPPGLTQDQRRLLDELCGQGLTPTGRQPQPPPQPQPMPRAGSGPVIRDLSAGDGSIGAYRGPDRGRAGACPDDGACHHQCDPGSCFRVHHAGPLTVAGFGDTWPQEIKDTYRDGGHL